MIHHEKCIIPKKTKRFFHPLKNSFSKISMEYVFLEKNRKNNFLLEVQKHFNI